MDIGVVLATATWLVGVALIVVMALLPWLEMLAGRVAEVGPAQGGRGAERLHDAAGLQQGAHATSLSKVASRDAVVSSHLMSASRWCSA